MEDTMQYKSPEELYDEVNDLYQYVWERGEEKYGKWKGEIEREDFNESAKNLLYYLSLRRKDIRSLQNSLIPWGLSSLGRLESKTLCTLRSVLATLADIGDIESSIKHPPLEEFLEGRQWLDKNTRDIFGEKPDHYRTRIMVTLGTEAGDEPKFVEKLMESGMNIARINCSHDSPKVWDAMIENITKAKKKTGKDCKILMDISGPKIRISWVWTKYKASKVKEGDCIQIVRDMPNIDQIDPKALVVVGTTVPQVFDSLKEEDRVRIDDGIVEGKIVRIDKGGAIFQVEKVNGSSARIKAEKGLNFPDTNFTVNILDKKDLDDLAYASKKADILCFSFIRNKEDIYNIQKEMENIIGDKAKDIALMAKIETLSGVEKLAEIIMAGASKNPFAIMIARGDLAVEVGYIRLAELQQEISWICEAASIPVVWATEVFANLVENGVPSRAEITDVVEGSLAECIMLNKGVYVNEAVKMLANILKNVEIHQYKKTPQLRALNIAKLD